MKLTSWYSKSLLMATFGAVIGYFAATSRIEPVKSAEATEPQSTNVVKSAPSPGKREVRNADAIRRQDELRLVSHNQVATAKAAQTGKKPNILIIWGDDIGWNNPSAYNRGMMGYSTPNIDRVAKEGGIVHRLVWTAVVHGGTGGFHYRPESVPHRVAQSRPPGREGRAVR